MMNGYAFEKLAANPPENVDAEVDEIIADIDKLPLINAGELRIVRSDVSKPLTIV